MDLYLCTSQDEVRDVMKRDLGDGLGDCKVFLTKLKACKQWIAVADLDATIG